MKNTESEKNRGNNGCKAIVININTNKKFKMYNKQNIQETSVEVNEAYEGETIEEKVRRLMDNKEPIEDSAPMIWTERKDGVIKEYDIRHDRFETAVEMMDQANQQKLSDRKLRIASREIPKTDGQKTDETGKTGTGKEGGA